MVTSRFKPYTRRFNARSMFATRAFARHAAPFVRRAVSRTASSFRSLLGKPRASLANPRYRKRMRVPRFRRGGSGYAKTVTKRRRMSRSTKKYNQKIWSIANPSKMSNSVRALASGTIASLANLCKYTDFSFLGQDEVNFSRAATKVIAHDGTAGPPVETDYPEASHIINAYHKYTFRNNGIVPCTLQATWYHTLAPTSQDPTTNWSQGMEDRDADAGKTVASWTTDPLFNIREVWAR